MLQLSVLSRLFFDVETIVAGEMSNTTCVELLAAVPKRVGKAAVLVALTTIGALLLSERKLTALVESVAV